MSSKQDQQSSPSTSSETSTRPSYPNSPQLSCSDLSGISIHSQNNTLFNQNFESLNDPKALLCPVIENPYFFQEEGLKSEIN